MKILLAVTVLVLTSQVDGYAAGQVVSGGQDASKYCTDCKAFFGDIHQIIASPNTSKMMIQMFDNLVCTQLGPFADMCKGFVAEIVPQLISYVAGFDNPDELCSVIGMCPQNAAPRKLKLFFKPLKGDLECDACKMGITELRNVLRNANTQTTVESFLKNDVCTIVGSFREQCKQLVDQYGTLLFQLLVNELDPTIICDDVHMCTGNQMKSLTRVGLTSSVTNVKVIGKQKPVQKTLGGTEECVLCEAVLTEIDQFIAENTTIAEVEAALLKVCNMLPTLVVADCVTGVKIVVPELLMLIKQVGPKAVCTELGLCTQGVKKVNIRKPSSVGGNETCVLCEFVMKELDLYIGNNKSEANVERALEQICMNVMPATIAAECKAFVEEYGPAIINLIVQELDPKKVCSTLRLCTGLQKLPVVQPKVGGPVCALCEMVMQELANMISDNATEAEIEQALEKVCSLLPSTLKDECDTFVQKYEALIIQLLLSEMDPKTICTHLGLCAGSIRVSGIPIQHVVPLKIVKQKKVGDPTCVLCEFVMKELDTLLGDNATQAEIEQALEEVCALLPSTIKTECDSFVEEYGPAVIQLLLQELDPKLVCTRIGLCSTTTAALLLKPAKSKKVGDELCTMCEMAINYVMSMLKKNGTVKEVEQLLDDICQRLPSTFDTECESFVAQYTPVIVQFLEGDLDAHSICQTLDLCSKSHVKTHNSNKLYFKQKNLGMKECSYGPAHWCKNKENAIKCNAVSYCMNHAWNF